MNAITRIFEMLKNAVRTWLWPIPAATQPLAQAERAAPPPPPPSKPIDFVQPEKKRTAKITEPSHTADEQTFGTYYHFDNVLNSLDSYFKYISYLQKDDRDTYDLYKNIGGQILGSKALIWVGALPTGWLKQRPSFGLVHFSNEDTAEKSGAKMMYYQKFQGYADLQPVAGDIYRVVLYYVLANDTKVRVPVVFFVHVSDQGEISLIKQRVSEPVRIRHKRKRKGTEDFSIAFREIWKVPDMLLDILKENRSELEADGVKTVSEAAAHIFTVIASACYNSTDGVRVNVYRNNVACVFNVAMSRTAYFFRDREKTVTENGSTKRIFHATRAHFRNYADGRIVPVRMHFKGEREFNWNGYNVIITVSGLHHVDINNFSAAAINMDQKNDIEGMIGMSKVGKILAAEIKKKPDTLQVY